MATATQVVFGCVILLGLTSLLVYHPSRPYSTLLPAVLTNFSIVSLTRKGVLSVLGWEEDTSDSLGIYSDRLYPNDVYDFDYDDDNANNRSTSELIDEYEHGQDEDYPPEDGEDEPASDEEWETMMEKRFAERREILKSTCRKYRGTFTSRSQYTLKKRLYYNKKYRLMVCAVAKAGSSTWKNHLLAMKGVTNYTRNVHKYKGLLARTQLSVPGMWRAMSATNTTKVMNVRQPLERLVSAYRDKYNDGQPITDARYQRWVVTLRQELGKAFLPKDKTNVTFSEFLTYVLSQQKTPWSVNIHWANYHRSCSPCYFNYQYIIKTETYSEDLRYIVNRLRAKEVEVEAVRHSTGTHYSTSYSHYYNEVTPHILRQLYQTYKIDFEMFDYEIPQFLRDVVNDTVTPGEK